MKLVHKHPMLGSSVDKDSISLTIKGFGVAIIPAVIAISKLFDVELVEGDLIQLVNSIASMASMVMVIYGLGRKYFNK